MIYDSSRARGSWGVATPHRAASEAAATVLAGGGTAVDAAICAAGVLCVVYPHNCSVGGDLIGLVRQGTRRPKSVFGVGRAARAADADSLRREHGDRMPVVGPHSITVPGVVSGWVAMHELGGSVPLERLLEPAVAAAAGGFVVGGSLARALGELETDDPGMAEIFGPQGRRLGTGDVLVQARLAETILKLAKDPDGCYRGDLGARLVAGLVSAGSPLRERDFHEHRAVVTGALETEGGRLAPSLFTAGLPSQGAYLGALVSILSTLFDNGRALLGRDAHLLARAFSGFSRIRDELVCDPSKSPGPDPGTFEDRLRLMGLPGDEQSSLRSVPGRAGAGDRAASPSGDTVAVVARDAAGGSVSMLQSNFYSFGSKVLDPETGVVFHNRGAMFSLKRGAPAELAPRLCPPHTLCPVMVDAGHAEPVLLLSSMGGRAQPQILSRVLLHLASGMDLSEALASPRYVVGDTGTAGEYRLVTAEADVAAEELTSLAAGGFDVRTVGRWSESTGHAQALRAGADGSIEGASDPRSDGTAICGC